MASSGAFSMAEKAKQFLIVSRYEFFPAGIGIVAVPTLLAATSVSELVSSLDMVVWGAAVWYLSLIIGAQINCVSDYGLDHGYKGKFPRAIDTLGRQTIVRSIFVEIILASAIVVWLAIDLSRYQLLAFWVVGLTLAITYSLEPLRFKKRGMLNVLTLSLVLYGLPALFIYFLVVDSIGLLLLIILIAVGVQGIGMILANEIEDYPEDMAMGVRNPCVNWGVKKTSLVALLMTTAAGVGLMVAFAILLTDPYARLAASLVSVLMYCLVFKEQYQMYKLCSVHGGTQDDKVMREVRSLGSRLPTWLSWLSIPLLVASGLTVL